MTGDDDIVFSAKTGRQIGPSSEAGSNVIPFPRGASARPKPDPLSYAERVTIRTTATFEHTDRAAQDEVAAIAQSSDDLEDI
jgi:hypothetical protein